MSAISMKELLESGVHFGHQKGAWNPKMKEYIFTQRNGIHIINLEKTLKYAQKAYDYMLEQSKQGKKILFVGTKKQAQESIKKEAERAGVYYISHKWLGGMLTNFKTLRSRVERLKEIERQESMGEFELLPKKEVSELLVEKTKLSNRFSGVKEMTSLPDVLFVIDPKNEKTAVKEAKKLNIPVVALTDTNCDPDMVDVIIPGNDDAIRAVNLMASKMANAIIEGREGKEGKDDKVSDKEENTDEENSEDNKKEDSEEK